MADLNCDKSILLSTEKKRRAWYGLLIGDAYGAGWETKSHHYIENNTDELDKGYKQRDVGYRGMNKPGDYTDDTAMTIGVAQAMSVTQKKLTFIALAEAWNKIYANDCKENPEGVLIPRFGWGSWRKVATSSMLMQDWKTVWTDTREDQSKRLEPTNGCNMRQLPIIIECIDRSFSDPSGNLKYMMENIFTQVMSTHPHPIAFVSCAAQVLAAQWLYTIGQPDPYTGDSEPHSWKFMIRYVSRCMKIYISSFQKHFDDNVLSDAIETFLKKLDEIDQLPEITNTTCKDLPNTIWDTICFEGALGLSVSSPQTAYASLYFLKWSHNTTVYNNLKRVVSFGGDTDTLAAIVMPVVMMTQQVDTPIDELFPGWVMEGLEIPDSFEELVNL